MATPTTRTVLITGGNRGLGLQTGVVLARDGHRVVLGSRDLAKGEAAAAPLREEGRSVEAVELDVADDASIDAALAELEGRGLRPERGAGSASHGGLLEERGPSAASRPAIGRTRRRTERRSRYGSRAAAAPQTARRQRACPGCGAGLPGAQRRRSR